jgi:hypothetical protein
MGNETQRDTGSQTQDGDAMATRSPQTDRFAEAGEAQDDSFDAGVSDEERRRMIAETAYFIAQRREFDGGLELEDWLAAEAEVNTRLASTRSR